MKLIKTFKSGYGKNLKNFSDMAPYGDSEMGISPRGLVPPGAGYHVGEDL